MKLAHGQGHQILLTGVTGFVGKVVLEELLRRQDELSVGTVYVLIRKNKAGDDAETRFEREVVGSPCFAQLPQGWQQRVRAVQGDLGESGCGIENETAQALAERLSHIINCAASVDFSRLWESGSRIRYCRGCGRQRACRPLPGRTRSR